jgi:PqqD family protein of HPr-rel-A system
MLRRDWDDEAVIYDVIAGTTHFIDSVAAAVLGCLSAQPVAAASIARSLLPQFEPESEADLLAAVRESLAKLQQMGLIQPVDV